MVIFMTATCKVYHQNIFWLSMVFILQVNLAVEASKVVRNQCYQLLILVDNLKTYSIKLPELHKAVVSLNVYVLDHDIFHNKIIEMFNYKTELFLEYQSSSSYCLY